MRARAAALALAGLAVAAGCGVSETDDNVVTSVPAEARAYLHLDRQADDWAEARDALARLPALEGMVIPLLEGAVEVPGNGEAGVALLPGRKEPLVLGPDDPEAPRSLADEAEYGELLDGLPEQRLAHLYLGRGAIDFLRSLDSTVTAAAAAADVIEDDRMRLRARVLHDGAPGPCGAKDDDSGLVDVADPDAAFYLELSSVSCALEALAARDDGVRAAIRTFGRAAGRRGRVSLEDELLPLLGRRGALIAVPGERAPTLTFILDDVEEEAALDMLARLQPALIHLLGVEELGQAPTFGAADVGGITAITAQLAPGLEVSYAAWDRRLVVSTSLRGIAAVRRGEGLPGSDGFDAVLGSRPDAHSALVFLDLHQLLTLAEQAGLGEDPRYLAVRDDLQKLRAAGAAVSREDQFTTAELTFQIP